mmetsp:Transcript_81490/g.217983  ORF Transcript_81490/g.217983 Transcript_81490/m.217983 type:complete len:80 (-) Transcript_81490:324-563(-)
MKPRAGLDKRRGACTTCIVGDNVDDVTFWGVRIKCHGAPCVFVVSCLVFCRGQAKSLIDVDVSVSFILQGSATPVMGLS